MDKTPVSKVSSMHPMIARPLFLPSHIRNSSGYGGAEVVALFPMVCKINLALGLLALAGEPQVDHND